MDKLIRRHKIIFMLMPLITLVIGVMGSMASCGEDTSDGPDATGRSIVGKWLCREDAFGKPWEESLIYMFADDGSGYEWFQDLPYSQRRIFRYAVSGNCILLQDWDGEDSVKINYELSKNGNQLMLYGLDDDNMRELHFVRAAE